MRIPLSALLILLCLFAPAASAAEAAPVSFRREIAPIFLKQCAACHGPEKSKGKFRLDTFEWLAKPGESKVPSIKPGAAKDSQIYHLISTDAEEDRMPKKADPLPPSQVALIARWIDQGAKFDGPDPAAALATLVEDQDHPAPPEIYPQPVAITALAFSPDGKTLAVAGYHEITLWDPADGKLLGRIKKLGERVYAIAFSPDGTLLAAADGTPGVFGELRLCDPITQSPGKVLERINDVMLAARFSPDGTRVAAGGADNAVRIFNVANAKRELLIEQHADWVIDLAFSPDGLKLATASRDKSSRVFETKNGTMISAFLTHEDFVSGVAFSDDGKNIFTAGRDKKIRLWNAVDAKPIDRVSRFNGEPFKLEAAAGMLFASCADGIVRQYKQETMELIRPYPKVGDWVYSLAVDVKNKRVAAGCYNGEVKVWDFDKGTAVISFLAAPGIAPRK